jgi:hypothetical protein
MTKLAASATEPGLNSEPQNQGKANRRISNIEYRMSKEGILSILTKKDRAKRFHHSSFVIRHFRPPPVLQLMQLVVKSFSLHKLNMVAGFDDSAAVQYDDSIGIADG